MQYTDKKKTVNVALIGAGGIGREHAKGYALAGVAAPDIAARPVLKIICDVNEAVARAKGEEWGFEEYCTDYHEILKRDDIDIVDICTTARFHTDIAIDFIKEKKFFVACEKPLVTTMEDADRLMSTIKESEWDEHTATCFNKIRFQGVAYARELVKSGALGKITMYHGRYNSGGPVEFYDPRWMRPWQVTGGWADCGSHLVDMCRFILDDHFDEITGLVGAAPAKLYEHVPAEGESLESIPMVPNPNENYGMIMGRMKSGVPVTLVHNGVYLGAREEVSYEVCGTKASIRWCATNPNVVEICEAGGFKTSGFKRITMSKLHPYGNCTANFSSFAKGCTDQMMFEMYDIVNACVNKTKFTPTMLETYEVLRVCQIARDCNGQDGWVKV